VAALLVAAGVLGALVGSFLNVVAWRLPRGESLLRPGSHCPHCEAPVRARHNVPVLGWLVLRGRCADCGAPISARYPAIEALTAALFVAVVAATGADHDVVIGLLLVSALVPIALIDLDHMRIPDLITGPVAIGIVALALALDPGSVVERLIAGALAGGVFFVILFAYPKGMGMGDVKLAAVLGLALGSAVAPAIFAALLAGSGTGVVLSVRHGVAVARKTLVPFGVFLAFGGVVGLLCGPQLVSWYVGTFA
jgi:leader peptidase (prepilin peptidase) / N-methyltransferase